MATNNSSDSINFNFNNSIPSIAYKQILASAETAMYSPEEINNHIFSPKNFIDGFTSIYFYENKLFGKYEYNPLEITLPKSGIKYMHLWFDCCDYYYQQETILKDGYKPYGPIYTSIYASVTNNDKITFTKDANGKYKAIIPDGVKLIYGAGIDFERDNYNRIIKYHTNKGCMTYPEFPVDISNNTGKIWLQVVHNIPEMNIAGSDSSLANVGLIHEFVPVFYDHYGIAVSSWNNATFNALNGDIPFVKL